MLLPLLLIDHIPLDVWAETALEMLDVRDLMKMATDASLLLLLPAGAVFVAKRVLSADEIAWFAERDISLRLLVERRVTTYSKSDRMLFSEMTMWITNGKVHRDSDLPAIEWGDLGILREWLVDNKLHRDNDQPAVEYSKYYKYWYKHGLRHREGDLPAVELSDGTREWWVEGKLHRDNGLPATERANGRREWWVHGIRIMPRAL